MNFRMNQCKYTTLGVSMVSTIWRQLLTIPSLNSRFWRISRKMHVTVNYWTIFFGAHAPSWAKAAAAAKAAAWWPRQTRTDLGGVTSLQYWFKRIQHWISSCMDDVPRRIIITGHMNGSCICHCPAKKIRMQMSTDSTVRAQHTLIAWTCTIRHNQKSSYEMEI